MLFTFIKLCDPCGSQSSRPKVILPETRVMSPESFSLVTKNAELCLVPGDITSGEMTFGQLNHKPVPPHAMSA